MGIGNAARPWWCQDPTCTPVSNTPHADKRAAYAVSGFCSGLLPEVRLRDIQGQRHCNDMHLCFRSALRGVVMLEVNATDVQNVARCAFRALIAKDPAERINVRWYTGRAGDSGLLADGHSAASPADADGSEGAR